MPETIYKKFFIVYECQDFGIFFKKKISGSLVMEIDMDTINTLNENNLCQYFQNMLVLQTGRNDAKILSMTKLN